VLLLVEGEAGGAGGGPAFGDEFNGGASNRGTSSD
jgi:hypothetical protein